MLILAQPHERAVLANLLSSIFPSSSHEVRILTPGGFAHYAASLRGASRALPAFGSRADSVRVGARASLGASLHRLGLGVFCPPNAPEKYVEPLARLFNDLQWSGVRGADFSSWAAAEGVADEEHALLAAAYSAWLHEPSARALMPHLLDVVEAPGGTRDAARAQAHDETQLVLVSDADVMGGGVAQLLCALYGSRAEQEETRTVLFGGSDSSVRAGAVVGGAAGDSAVGVGGSLPNVLAPGVIEFFVDVGSDAAACSRGSLRHHLRAAVKAEREREGRRQEAVIGERLFSWQFNEVDHVSSFSSPAIADAVRVLRSGALAAPATAAAAWRRRAKEEKVGAAVGGAAAEDAESSGSAGSSPPDSRRAGSPPGSLVACLDGLPDVVYTQVRDGAGPAASQFDAVRAAQSAGAVEVAGVRAGGDARYVAVKIAEEAVRTAPAGGATIGVVVRAQADVQHVANLLAETLKDARIVTLTRTEIALIPEVRWTLAALAVIARPTDAMNWYALGSSPLYGLPVTTLGAWARAAARDVTQGGLFTFLVEAAALAPKAAAASPSDADTVSFNRNAAPALGDAESLHDKEVGVNEGGAFPSSRSAVVSSIEAEASLESSDSVAPGNNGVSTDAPGDSGNAQETLHTGGDLDDPSKFVGLSSAGPFQTLRAPPSPSPPRDSIVGGVLIPPSVALAAARLVHDTRALLRSYLSSRSVAAALTAWVNASGLAHSLDSAATPAHALAGAGVAALLNAAATLESSGTEGGGAAMRAEGRALADEWGSPTVSSIVRARGSLQPLEGLPFVFDALSTLVYKGRIAVRTEPAPTHHYFGGVDEGGDAADADMALSLHTTAGSRVSNGSADESAVASASVSDILASQACAQVLAGLDDTACVSAATGGSEEKGGGGGGIVVPLQHLRPPPSGGSVVVVLTANAALGGTFDTLVVVNVSATAWPGAFTDSVLPYPTGVFKWGAPHASDRVQHAAVRRDDFADLLARARDRVVLIAPAVTADAPVLSRGRSRFIDEIFPPPPVHLSADFDKGVGGAGGGNAGVPEPQRTASPSVTAAALPRLSYSSVSDYEWCPKRYHLSRVAALPTPPSVHLFYGSALHAAAALAGEAIGRALVGAAEDATRRADKVPAVDVAATALAALLADQHLRAAALDALPSDDALADAMHAAYRAAWLKDDKRSWSAGALGSAGGGDDAALPLALRATVTGDGLLIDAAAKLGLPLPQIVALDTGAREACVRFASDELGRARSWLLSADPFDAPHPVNAGVAPAAPFVPALVERFFECTVSSFGGGPRVRVAGVIDRVDVVASRTRGAPPHLLVREFKSSQHWKRQRTAKAPSALKAMMRGSIQADLYAIALASMKSDEKWATPFSSPTVAAATLTALKKGGAEGSASPAAAVALVNFEGIEDGAVESCVPTQRDMALAGARVARTAAAIANGVFAPTPSPVKCTYCAFDKVCEDAWEGKRPAAKMISVREAAL